MSAAQRGFADHTTTLTAAEDRASADPELPTLSALRARPDTVGWHGRDDIGREWVSPGRTVIEVPYWHWPIARPEDCDDQTSTGIWFDATGAPALDPCKPDTPDGVVLLCRRCGLDCT